MEMRVGSTFKGLKSGLIFSIGDPFRVSAARGRGGTAQPLDPVCRLQVLSLFPVSAICVCLGLLTSPWGLGLSRPLLRRQGCFRGFP